uniref:beta-N-acetylhexosaminidase n=1 Tax=Ascaris lumbricoides TaxID=6252 RepID=A0A9J2PWA9_ASCLU
MSDNIFAAASVHLCHSQEETFALKFSTDLFSSNPPHIFFVYRLVISIAAYSSYPCTFQAGSSGMSNAPLPTALSSSVALLLVGSGLLYFLVISQSVPVEKRSGILQAMQRPTTRSNPFAEKIVHFDLKGAAPKVSYFTEIFPMLSLLNVTSVLMEYEDMFPYSGQVAILKRTIAYSEDEIATILEVAKKNKLEVIPLVQTFGHLEFALKYDRFSHLREDPERMDTLCPSENESWTLITELLTQVRNLHPDVKRIHIGADEAWQIAKDGRCLERLRTELGFSTDRLKLAHIARTARFAREKLHFEEVLAWNDMFGAISDKLMLKYELGTLITPVIWGYAVDVTRPGYFPDGMFERYSKVFDKLMFASAFKGANGIAEIYANVNRYFANQQSYVKLYEMHKTHLEGRVKGIVLTGWQRYYHSAPLCELLPVSVPSLVSDLIYLENTSLSFSQVMHLARVENLRFFVWRIHRFTYSNSAREIIREQLADLEQKIRHALSAYFYDETVDEFIFANIASLKMLL